MRRTLIAAAIFCVSAPANVASAAPPMKRELAKYSAHYYAVRELHGVRAPGRNIRRYGVRVGRRVRAATAAEVARSIRQLRALLTPRVTGGPLAAIAACESGGNPRAVSAGGTYRGKYQFDFQTWRSVGGSGDPAAAPEAEQDLRAAMLYARRGSQPWPRCG